jgi:hypothetical protein
MADERNCAPFGQRGARVVETERLERRGHRAIEPDEGVIEHLTVARIAHLRQKHLGAAVDIARGKTMKHTG